MKCPKCGNTLNQKNIKHVTKGDKLYIICKNCGAIVMTIDISERNI